MKSDIFGLAALLTYHTNCSIVAATLINECPYGTMININPAEVFKATNLGKTYRNIFNGKENDTFHVTYVLPNYISTGFFYSVTFTVDNEVSKVKVVMVTLDDKEITEVSSSKDYNSLLHFSVRICTTFLHHLLRSYISVEFSA